MIWVQLLLPILGQDLRVPAEIRGEVAGFVTVLAETTGKTVKFFPIDPGLSVFPAGLLANPKATVVSSSQPGVYRLLCYSAKADEPSDPQICRVIIGNPRPEPQPDPAPDPTPDVKPQPAPIPLDGLRVLMVYDSEQLAKLPAAQHAIFYSNEIRAYLTSKCAISPKGQREWRVWTSTTDASGEAEHWQQAMARPRKSLPWLIISNGKTGYEGPLPANVADTLKLIQTYAGN